MSELDHLLELLFEHPKMPKSAKTSIRERIKHIQTNISSPQKTQISMGAIPAHLAGQSASTIANLMKEPASVEPTVPFVVAATAATAQALEQRQRAIQIAQSGKPEAGRTSPRKF